MKRGPSMQVEQSSEPLGLEAMREVLEDKLRELDAGWALYGGPFDGGWVSEVLASLQLPETEKETHTNQPPESGER